MITGGTGFLGSYLTRYLVRKKAISGKELLLFDRYPNRERITEVASDVVVMTGGITEPSEIAAAMKAYDIDRVFHPAAILGEPARAQAVSFSNRKKQSRTGTNDQNESAERHRSTAHWGGVMATSFGVSRNDDCCAIFFGLG
jgi:uncharacterized protein YbjT (DUF2867 family)